MRICIYELSHHETAWALLQVLEVPGNAITLFVSQGVARHLHDAQGVDAQRHQWIVQGPEQSERSFIASMHAWCLDHRPDILLLATVESNHLPVARALRGSKNTRVLLMIHDVHNYFQSRPSMSVRGLVRHFGKKALLHRVSGFMSISERVRDHLAGFVKDGRPVIRLAGAVFDPATYAPATLQAGGPVRIVVPGSYDMRRRDYESLFRIAGELEEHKVVVRIDLLGGPGPDTERILSMCRAWKGVHVKFSWYGEQEVPETEFAHQIQYAHFIWVPSVIQTSIADGILEVYGKSKSSGNVFDGIRFARPLLTPEALQVDPMQRPACFRYATSVDLVSFIASMARNPEGYVPWREAALQVSDLFTVDRLRAKLPDLLTLP